MRVRPPFGDPQHSRRHHTVSAYARPLLAAALLFTAWGAFAPGPAYAQGVPANVPGTLLRRLADAADAFRTGTSVWVVADPNPPHEVSGVYDTQAAADADTMIADGFQRYGPFVTPVDSGSVRQIFAVCIHRIRPYSNWSCPPGGQQPPFPLDSVLSIQVTVNASNREPMQMTLSPDSVDLVFFTLSAFDKYLAPYYTSAYGAGFTAVLRDSLAAAIRREND